MVLCVLGAVSLGLLICFVVGASCGRFGASSEPLGTLRGVHGGLLGPTWDPLALFLGLLEDLLGPSSGFARTPWQLFNGT